MLQPARNHWRKRSKHHHQTDKAGAKRTDAAKSEALDQHVDRIIIEEDIPGPDSMQRSLPALPLYIRMSRAMRMIMIFIRIAITHCIAPIPPPRFSTMDSQAN